MNILFNKISNSLFLLISISITGQICLKLYEMSVSQLPKSSPLDTTNLFISIGTGIALIIAFLLAVKELISVYRYFNTPDSKTKTNYVDKIILK